MTNLGPNRTHVATLIRVDQPFPESTDRRRHPSGPLEAGGDLRGGGVEKLVATNSNLSGFHPAVRKDYGVRYLPPTRFKEKVFASVIKNESHQKSSSHCSYIYIHTFPRENFLGEINCHRRRIGSMKDGIVLPFPCNKMLAWVKGKVPKVDFDG